MPEGIFASLGGEKVAGYEIHMGRTEAADNDGVLQPFVIGPDGEVLGYAAGTVAGSYIHGIFDEVAFREAFINLLYARKGKTRGESEHLSIHEYREQQFDKLAQILRESLDMEKIYTILGF